MKPCVYSKLQGYGHLLLQAFLSANNLKLIIRSHEGPDARMKRAEEDQMPSIDTGYSVDHETPSKLGFGFTSTFCPKVSGCGS
jgi:hypothetical protein